VAIVAGAMPTSRSNSSENYWSPFLQQQRPAGAQGATLSGDDGERVASTLWRLLGNRIDAPFTLRARASAVRGVVPSRSNPPP
jgi:hypothetical protein